MKIRNGFVSNSSSASYIVKIVNTSFDEFCSCLLTEYSWSYFDRGALMNRIDKRLEETRERVKEAKQGDDMASYHVKFLNDLEVSKSKLEKIVNDSEGDIDGFNRKLVKFVLEYHGIDAAITLDDGIKLSDFTPMHNDYHNGPHELLREIILFFMFEYHKKLECEVDHN